MTPSDPLLDYGQAARYLGDVSVRTVQREVRDGRLKAIKGVRGALFAQSELDRYLRASARRNAEPETEAIPTRYTLYRFFDASGDLLYVGITTTGANRWLQHSKDQPWWLEVATITVEHFDSAEALIAAESAAIRDEQPRYNVVGRPR